ncbi:MAG: enoyl-CoA hydratase/isomerase family protein [Dehalococcoidia bacterium]|nr:enoyl-CoA hydratase/isomerase family protein [Dehalococcoidia bacterium]
MAFIEADRQGDVLWLTLNRPERLNAVHLAMRDELWTMFELIRLDPSIRVAVLRGAGDRAFSAGADILEFGTAPSVVASREARQQRDIWGVMSTLPIPLVAAIHGFAYGAGFEMSMYCDLRVCAEDARFALPEVTLGYIPSAGGTQTVARHTSRSDVLRLVTTGEPMTAPEAFEAGLVHAVVPRAELETTARVWAQRLASLPPSAIKAAKRAVIEGIDMPLSHALEFERVLAAEVAMGVGA